MPSVFLTPAALATAESLASRAETEKRSASNMAEQEFTAKDAWLHILSLDRPLPFRHGEKKTACRVLRLARVRHAADCARARRSGKRRINSRRRSFVRQ